MASVVTRLGRRGEALPIDRDQGVFPHPAHACDISGRGVGSAAQGYMQTGCIRSAGHRRTHRHDDQDVRNRHDVVAIVDQTIADERWRVAGRRFRRSSRRPLRLRVPHRALSIMTPTEPCSFRLQATFHWLHDRLHDRVGPSPGGTIALAYRSRPKRCCWREPRLGPGDPRHQPAGLQFRMPAMTNQRLALSLMLTAGSPGR